MFELTDETSPILNDKDTNCNNSYGTNHHQENENTSISSTSGRSIPSNTDNSINYEISNVVYPLSVKIMLLSKFFESICANGIRTILVLHLHTYLKIEYHTSVTILHVFNFIGQFCPLLGAVLADNYYGNTRTIMLFLIFYGLGFIGVILVTIPIELFRTRCQIFLSLFLISLGNGSIRACLTSLGGRQYKLPEEKFKLTSFFFLYYVVYTSGILISKFLPPIIRINTFCFGEDSCYPAVYGFLFSTFLLSSITFISGLKFYKHTNEKKKSMLLMFLKYLFVRTKFIITEKITFYRKRNSITNSDYLNHFDETFLTDIECYLNIIKLFVPLPVYWSLYTQQDSTWTLQATKMNTQIFGLHIPPDQVKSCAPIFLLILIPTWEKKIKPLLIKININITPIKSIIMGGIFASFSFLLAGLNEININQYTSQPSILLQLPQFSFLMLGEVLLSIPGLQFSFTQAPDRMVSLLVASWFVNNAMGNLIVIIITKLEIFQSQTYEFFFYSILMLVSMVWFYYLSRNYKYLNERNNKNIIT